MILWNTASSLTYLCRIPLYPLQTLFDSPLKSRIWEFPRIGGGSGFFNRSKEILEEIDRQIFNIKGKGEKGQRRCSAIVRLCKSSWPFLHILYFDVCPSWWALFCTFQTFHGTFVISVAVAGVYFALVCDALHLCNRVMLVYTQKIEFLSTLQYSVYVCCSRLKKNWEPLCLLALVVVSAFITAFLIISLCHKRRKFLLFLLFASDMYPIRMFLYVTYFQFRCGGGGGGMQAIPNWHQSFLKETTLPPSDMRRKC